MRASSDGRSSVPICISVTGTTHRWPRTIRAAIGSREASRPQRLTADHPDRNLPALQFCPRGRRQAGLSPFSSQTPARAFPFSLNPPAKAAIPQRQQVSEVPQICGRRVDRQIRNPPAKIGGVIRDSDLQPFATVISPNVGRRPRPFDSENLPIEPEEFTNHKCRGFACVGRCPFHG